MRILFSQIALKHICDVRNSQLGTALLISVNDRGIYYFARVLISRNFANSHLRSFTKKDSQNFSKTWIIPIFISCIFVWFDSLRPINNLSVIKGQVFLGWTSTKLGLMFLLKDTTQWRRWGLNPLPLGLESSTLPLSHCAPISGIWFFHCHNEGHLMQGMALLIKIGSPEEFPKPPPYFPKCGGYTYRRTGDDTTSQARETKSTALLILCIVTVVIMCLFV